METKPINKKKIEGISTLAISKQNLKTVQAIAQHLTQKDF
jgi:hypothetical protein